MTGESWNHEVGAISWFEIDTTSIIAHELGHTLDLGHPTGGVNPIDPSVMTAGPDTGQIRRRDLYQYDYKCIDESRGNLRNLSGKYYYVNNSTLSGPTTFTGSFDVAKLTPGLSWNNWLSWSWSGITSSCSSWSRGLNSPNTQCVDDSLSNSSRYGVGFLEATFREDTSWDRTIFSNYQDSQLPNTSGLYEQGNLVNYYRSNDSFQTQSNLGYLYHCNSMTGWMSCSSSSNLYSGHKLALAWDEQHSRTVVGWLDQTRQNNNTDRRIMLSVGYTTEISLFNTPIMTLAEPDTLGTRRSAITPGLACKQNAAYGSRDCILAYVPDDTVNGDIKITAFSITQSINRYVIFNIASDRSLFTGARTANDIAIWYHDSKFWIAYKGFDLLNKSSMYIYSSSNGGYTWSYHQKYPTSSPTGPSAVGYWSGNNILTWVE